MFTLHSRFAIVLFVDGATPTALATDPSVSSSRLVSAIAMPKPYRYDALAVG